LVGFLEEDEVLASADPASFASRCDMALA